jgi:hypothetical protein
MRSKWPAFNDGVCELARDAAESSSFGARHNIRTMDDLDVYECSHYSRMSVRAQDVEFAEQIGISLAIKIRIRNVLEAKPGDKVIIMRELYNIGSLDRSADLTQAYLYLEYVRDLEEVD